MAEEAGEKKHQPTERRLREAREKGQIRRSTDLPKSALTVLLVLAIFAIGSLLADALYAWMKASLEAAGSGGTTATRSLALYFFAALGALLTVAMVLAVMFGTFTGGWLFSLVTLAPDLERMSPGRSFGQIFSVTNLVEVAKSALKIVVIAGSGLLAFYLLRPGFLALASPRPLSLAALSAPVLWVIAASVAGAVVLAVADVGVQIWMNRRTLRMTDREMRDEMRRIPRRSTPARTPPCRHAEDGTGAADPGGPYGVRRHHQPYPLRGRIALPKRHRIGTCRRRQRGGPGRDTVVDGGAALCCSIGRGTAPCSCLASAGGPRSSGSPGLVSRCRGSSRLCLAPGPMACERWHATAAADVPRHARRRTGAA